MRAVARLREGKALLQTACQPTVDALLAERLMSSALAGPSTASNVVAQRAASDTRFISLGRLARYYSAGAGRGSGIRGTGSAVPTQVCQYCTVLQQQHCGIATCCIQLYCKFLHTAASQPSMLANRS